MSFSYITKQAIDSMERILLAAFSTSFKFELNLTMTFVRDAECPLPPHTVDSLSMTVTQTE